MIAELGCGVMNTELGHESYDCRAQLWSYQYKVRFGRLRNLCLQSSWALEL